MNTLIQNTPHNVTDDKAISLLLDLVSTPSLSMQEARCTALLCSRMSEMGFAASIDESGSVVGTRGDSSHHAKQLVLLGHIDTVPGDIPVRIDGDKMFGRGSVDAKGPLAAFTVAAARAKLPPGICIRVIGATEEEAATSKGARYACVNYRADACIIGEPSGVEGVTLGYKGRLIAKIEIETDSAHSAGPEPTASELMFEVWSRVRTACDALTPNAQRIFDRVQSRLRSVKSQHDGVRDLGEMILGFRLPPGVAPEQVENVCKDAVTSIGQQLHNTPGSVTHGVQLTSTFTGHELAYVADRSSCVARTLTNAIRAEGLKPVPKLKTGTADMNVVAPIWNCPIAAYGPGDSSLDHTPDEHISILEYLTSIRVLTRVIESIVSEL